VPDHVNGTEPAETFGDAFQRIEAMEFAAFICAPIPDQEEAHHTLYQVCFS